MAESRPLPTIPGGVKPGDVSREELADQDVDQDEEIYDDFNDATLDDKLSGHKDEDVPDGSTIGDSAKGAAKFEFTKTMSASQGFDVYLADDDEDVDLTPNLSRQNRESSFTSVSTYEYSIATGKVPMSQATKMKLRRHRHILVRDLDVTHIMDYLISKTIVSPGMADDIVKSNPTQKVRAAALLDLLEKRGEIAYAEFLNALHENDYDHLFYVMQESDREADSMDEIELDPYVGTLQSTAELFRTMEHALSKYEDSTERETRRKRLGDIIHIQQRACPTMEQPPGSDMYENTRRPSFGRSLSMEDKSGEFTTNIEVQGIMMEKGEFVVISQEKAQIDDRIVIHTRRGTVEVAKNLIKVYGDPTTEPYFYKTPILPKHVGKFMEQQTKQTPINGLFTVFVSTQVTPDIPYHLCISQIRGSPLVLPIYQLLDGYSLSQDNPERKFETVTELVKYYQYTSCPVSEVSLHCPMIEARANILPGEDYDSKWEVDASDLGEKAKNIGEGFFSIVQKVKYKNVSVALKTPDSQHKSLEDKISFLREAKLLMELKHKNIINLIGVRFQQEPYLILTEYISKGSLQKLLRKKKLPSNTGWLYNGLATPILSALNYLEGLGIVHRDIASRNVLITEDNIPKLIDFGLARKLLSQEERYRATKYERLPYRSAAPEVLATHFYSIKSDVWAFGVLLWEIHSNAQRPYNSLRTKEQVTAFIVLEGGRLSKPAKCSGDIYRVMHACWATDVRLRPSFSRLYESFQRHHYTDISPIETPYITEDIYGRVNQLSMAQKGISDKFFYGTSEHGSIKSNRSSFIENDYAEPIYLVPSMSHM